MEWYRVDVGFPRSPKVAAFARALGVKRDAATVAVLRLLDFAAVACETGDLSAVHADDVAEAMGLRGGQRVVDALVACGVLERTDGRLTIHGWWERQGPLLAGRERTRRFRERQRSVREAQGDVDAEFDAAPDARRNAREEAARRCRMDASGAEPVTLRVTLQDTLPSRVGNGPRPTDLPTNHEEHVSPPALRAGGLPDAAAAARDAGREAERPAWVALPTLSDAELFQLLGEAAAGAEAGDERQRRLFYAAQRERLRRSSEPGYAEGVSRSRAAKLTENVNVAAETDCRNAARPDGGTGAMDGSGSCQC